MMGIASDGGSKSRGTPGGREGDEEETFRVCDRRKECDFPPCACALPIAGSSQDVVSDKFDVNYFVHLAHVGEYYSVLHRITWYR